MEDNMEELRDGRRMLMILIVLALLAGYLSSMGIAERDDPAILAPSQQGIEETQVEDNLYVA